MYKRFLCIGGEQDGHFVEVREPKQEIRVCVYPKIDFRKLSGIVTLNTQPIRTEIYHRKRFDNKEYFCLEDMTDEEIIEKLSK
jgi:hypothetical protein